MVKILALGNEFIKEDSFAKEVSEKLSLSENPKIPEGPEYNIINVNDSFQLLDEIKDSEDEEIIIIDVVKNLKELKFLKIQDLNKNKILSAHDFDANFILQLLDPNIKILGLPQNPSQEDKEKIIEEVKKLIKK